jgi:hypothetical protein
MVIVEKIRGTGIVKSYGAGHTTELDRLLRNEAKAEAIHPDDYQYLCIYDDVDWYQNYTLSPEKFPAVLKILSDYWKAIPSRVVEYNKFFKLMGVK